MSRGLLQSAQSLLASVLALARTRMELFSTELQEELTRLFFTLIGALIVLLLATLGIGFVGFGLVIALSEEYRAPAAVALGIAFLALAFAAGWSLRRLAFDKPPAFAASLAELERDLLVARSAALRGEIGTELQPAVAQLAAADRLIAGLRRVLLWAVRLVPLYALLRRT